MSRTAMAMLIAVSVTLPATRAQVPAGEHPALGGRVTQEMVASELSHKQIRNHGLRIFSTPFNKHDGLGDGPMDRVDPTQPGGRPTLQDNGTFLRFNGLDSQSCLECHGVLSNATIPAQFAVGGVGGVSASAFPAVVDADIDDSAGNGFAAIDGRFINPPFSFGSGGVELLAKEMTAELQALEAQAEANPGTVVELVTKGVSFGSIQFQGGRFDTTGVEGIDADLVVRPFGRKGCCATVRDFDTGAMQFHHGMQPVEVVGEDVDADGDGVVNEITIGELSALHVFQTSLESPRQRGKSSAITHGAEVFEQVGCATCHVPELVTDGRVLDLAFPEVHTDPTANVYFSIDLSKKPARFKKSGTGVGVPLYADLKRHDLGPGLSESTGDPLDSWFTTARLWGVADTAPYLHDGRAPTLTEAILMHGGEAQRARDAFDVLSVTDKQDLLEFLRSLRVPKRPNRGLKSVPAPGY